MLKICNTIDFNRCDLDYYKICVDEQNRKNINKACNEFYKKRINEFIFKMKGKGYKITRETFHNDIYYNRAIRREYLKYEFMRIESVIYDFPTKYFIKEHHLNELFDYEKTDFFKIGDIVNVKFVGYPYKIYDIKNDMIYLEKPKYLTIN